MTVTTTMIPQVSPYTVDGTQFTNDMFNQYKTWGQSLLDQDAPDGMDSGLYDLAHALLIAHFYECKLGTIEMVSTTPGEFAWMKPGTTSFWIRYQAIIKSAGTAAPITRTYTQVQRADSKHGYRLDQSRTRRMFREDF